VKMLRMDAQFRKAVILVIGPDSSRAMYNAMHEYGADDFVPVPFAREELVSSIELPQFFELLKRKFQLWSEGYYDKK
jgi:DNA-binding response OmpR family regulator